MIRMPWLALGVLIVAQAIAHHAATAGRQVRHAR